MNPPDIDQPALRRAAFTAHIGKAPGNAQQSKRFAEYDWSFLLPGDRTSREPMAACIASEHAMAGS